MDIWPKYKSPLGYLAGDSKIDTYGVDHSKFSLRDEIAYQMARSEREGQLIKNLNSQGITKDYPQYGTNFWGGNGPLRSEDDHRFHDSCADVHLPAVRGAHCAGVFTQVLRRPSVRLRLDRGSHLHHGRH